MNKCTVCNSRKAKRKCIIENKAVCSECCGSTRNLAECKGCDFYAPSAKRYQDIPSYSVQEMDQRSDLQSVSMSIEHAFCLFDLNQAKKINDQIILQILELQLDKYHFNDTELVYKNLQVKEGFEFVDGYLASKNHEIENASLVKILTLLHFVIKRRTQGRREYLEFIHNYVGDNIENGMRMLDENRKN